MLLLPLRHLPLLLVLPLVPVRPSQAGLPAWVLVLYHVQLLILPSREVLAGDESVTQADSESLRHREGDFKGKV